MVDRHGYQGQQLQQVAGQTEPLKKTVHKHITRLIVVKFSVIFKRSTLCLQSEHKFGMLYSKFPTILNASDTERGKSCEKIYICSPCNCNDLLSYGLRILEQHGFRRRNGRNGDC